MSEFVNDQVRDAYINSLLRERDGYEAAGNTAGVKDVTAELQRVGAESKPKAKRAESALPLSPRPRKRANRHGLP